MLTNDDLIAYTSFKLPARYFNFHDDESMLNTFEESIILSGKQGDEKEGVVLMVFTVKVRLSLLTSALQQLHFLN